jgi:hypothetical protein
MTHTEIGSTKAISWVEFSTREPGLARFGADKLTAAPAYMATVRRSGLPRVHPVTPLMRPFGLFLYMEPTSPKGRDLRERGWFALHNGVPDNAGTGGEFWVTGLGFPVDDPDIWSEVAATATYTPLDRYILFELQLSEARCNGYGDVTLPATQRWAIES